MLELISQISLSEVTEIENAEAHPETTIPEKQSRSDALPLALNNKQAELILKFIRNITDQNVIDDQTANRIISKIPEPHLKRQWNNLWLILPICLFSLAIGLAVRDPHFIQKLTEIPLIISFAPWSTLITSLSFGLGLIWLCRFLIRKDAFSSYLLTTLIASSVCFFVFSCAATTLLSIKIEYAPLLTVVPVYIFSVWLQSRTLWVGALGFALASFLCPISFPNADGIFINSIPVASACLVFFGLVAFCVAKMVKIASIALNEIGLIHLQKLFFAPQISRIFNYLTLTLGLCLLSIFGAWSTTEYLPSTFRWDRASWIVVWMITGLYLTFHGRLKSDSFLKHLGFASLLTNSLIVLVWTSYDHMHLAVITALVAAISLLIGWKYSFFLNITSIRSLRQLFTVSPRNHLEHSLP